MVGDIFAYGDLDSIDCDKLAFEEKIMKETLGIIFVVSSVSRMMYVNRYGYKLRYRKWVKAGEACFWGLVFAVGVCWLMGL